MTNLLSMSSSNVGWLQYPQMQTQTSLQALIKHRHDLENLFLKNRLNCQFSIQILFSKPDSSSRDKRSLCQQAVALCHGNFDLPAFAESNALKEGKVGPCPLLRISEFQGFDDDSKPGPASRVEQILGNRDNEQNMTYVMQRCDVLQLILHFFGFVIMVNMPWNILFCFSSP